MNNYNGAYGIYDRCYGLDYMKGYSGFCENENAVTPAMLKKYYGYNSSYTGEAITVGIVVAYGSDTACRDAAVFSDAFSLFAPNISIVEQKGGFAGARTVNCWKTETAVDIQWVHAFAPRAKLRCYFAASDDFYELFCMIKEADKECDIVLLSFGKNEFAGETEYITFFENSKAIYVCACGNCGKTSFPACAPNVIAVGGTKIYFDTFGGALGQETPWMRTGGGISIYCHIPYYQKVFCGINELSHGMRAVPDMSFFACGSGGAAVFDSKKGWFTAKGTSVSAACVAGICALIAQKNKDLIKKKASFFYKLALGGGYENYKRVFNDVTAGENCGFDLLTGLGTPNISALLSVV